HVVGVLAGDADIDGGSEGVAQRPEEMRNQLGRQTADRFTGELAAELGVRPAGEIDGDLGQRLIHRQQKAVASDARFVPQGSSHRLAKRQRTILYGMVLVDLQIAAAGELQREAAVLGELLEHVIEEADVRADLNGRRRVQIETHLDVGLTRLSVNARRACSQLAHDCRPRLARITVLADAQPADSEVACELEVRVAIADHRARAEVDVLAHVVSDEACLGLAALAAVGAEVRTDEHRFEADSLGGEGVQNELLRSLECRARERAGAEPVLVGHHHEAKAAALQLCKRSEHARQEAHLLQGVHLLVRRLLDQRAVAIDQQNSRARAHRSASSSLSFWPTEPTLMRSALPNPGWLRTSRTRSRAARAAASAASGSANSTSRKLASLCHTRVTPRVSRKAALIRARSDRITSICWRAMATCAG